MDRPRLHFTNGKWTLSDRDSGYSRAITIEELNHLLADAFKHIELTLRTACSRPPE